MTRALLPPLPRDFRGEAILPPDDLSLWSGASGPFWSRPRAVLRPATPEDVACAVVWAADEGVALIPRGGGTGMPGGNVGPGVVLDLSGLSSVTAFPAGTGAPGSVRVHAGAGATAATARQAARRQGADLPALPSSARWCTVGGMVACNAAGARSFRHGAVRSWVREVEWVRADGSVERLSRGDAPTAEWGGIRTLLADRLPAPLPWPRVRKNSSGYALDAFLPSGDPLDLAVGSEGTLGIVTGAVLEAAPEPQARGVALLGVPDLAFLSWAAAEVEGVPGVSACEYFGRRLAELGGLGDEATLAPLDLGEGLLLVEVEGDRETVEAGLAALMRFAGAAGAVTATAPAEVERLWEFRHAASPTIAAALARGRRSTQFIEDAVVPVAVLGRYVQGLGEILRRHDTDAVVFGHAGDGNLHVNPLVDLGHPGWRLRVREILEETVSLVSSLGGTLAGEHGDGRLRTPFLPRIFHPAVVDAFAALKGALDPSGILNPGVVVPVPGMDPLAGLGDAPGFARGSQGPEAHP